MNTMKAQTSNARINGYENVYMIFLFFENAKVQKSNDAKKNKDVFHKKRKNNTVFSSLYRTKVIPFIKDDKY